MAIGHKLKGRAFCQLPYMEFGRPKKPIYGKIQGVRKIVFLFLSSPSSSVEKEVADDGKKLHNYEKNTPAILH